MRHCLPMAVLLVAACSLGACQKHHEPPPENQQVESPEPAPPAPAPETPATPAPKPAKPKIKAPPKPSADEQITDDADATGMTSHTSPGGDEGSADAAGNSQL